MAKKYKNINNLMNDIRSITADALKERVALKVKDIFQDFLYIEVYANNDPISYKRTEELLNSLRVSPVITTDNKVAVSIFIDNDTMHSGGMWYDVPEMGLVTGDEVTLDEVAEILENGYNRLRGSTDFMVQTIDYLRDYSVIIRELQKYLKSRGIKYI